MDDPLLPWWSVLLLGMWAAALTVWVHPDVHREARLWAGVSTLVYVALIFMALGGNPLAGLPNSPSSATYSAIDVLFGVCGFISLTFSIWMLAPISLRSRSLCYILLTIANAIVCLVMRQTEIAIGLFLVALIAMKPIFAEFSRNGISSLRGWSFDFLRFTNQPVATSHRGEFWMIGGLSIVFSLALLGTVSHSLRIETQGTADDTRHAAMPHRDQIARVVGKGHDARKETSLVELALGTRADIVVLMTVIVFLRMAMTFTDVVKPGQSTDRLKTPTVNSLE